MAGFSPGRQLRVYRVKVLVRRDPLDPSFWVARAQVEGELVVDQGRTPEEALRNIREALLLTLEDIYGGPVEVELEADVYPASSTPRRGAGTRL